MLLGGCAGSSIFQRYNAANNQPTLSGTDYLQLANNAQGEKKQDYLLLAADRFAQNRQYDNAQLALNRTTTDALNPDQQAQKKIIQAEIWVDTERADDALNLLRQVSASNVALSTATQIKLHETLAAVYRKQGNTLFAIDEQTNVTSLLPNNQKEAELIGLLEYLQQQNPQTLQMLEQSASNDNERGWISLALLSERNPAESKLLESLKQWEVRFPDHAARSLVGNVEIRNALMSVTPKQIALLLPLTGPLSQQGNAIRNGFFAAYYSANSKPNITVYDTNQKDILAVYQQAVQNGANFVVGPLTKENVSTLASSNNLTVPTLALNTIDNNNTRINNLFQFGLIPTDEAVQAAVKAWNDGHNRVLMITPKGAYGDRVAESFAKEWQLLGGKVVGELSYTSRKNFNTEIQTLLNIDDSEQNARTIQQLVHQNIRFLPRRRKDFDAIFVAGLPNQAREILPLLNFYYAGDIATYATSSVYAGNPNPNVDHDLNGVIFDDIPWVLETNGGLPPSMANTRSHIENLWPNSYQRNVRLYALGSDAYNLIPQLGKLILLPQLGVYGATGMLYLLPNQHIYRKLLWAQMRDGSPTRIDTN